MDISSSIELYDSDVNVIKRVAQRLSEKVGTNQPLEAFANEIVGRFREAGYETEVICHEVYEDEAQERVSHYTFAVQIEGRVEAESEYDHDRQRHEVRSNVKGEKGRDSTQPVSVGGFGKTKSGLYVPPGAN